MIGGTILLISDQPTWSRELALRLNKVGTCRTIGPHDPEHDTSPLAAVVTDVDFRGSRVIERLRSLLSKPRADGKPILVLLRHDGHAERVQAAALGATLVFTPRTSAGEIVAALTAANGAADTKVASAADLTPSQNIEQAGLQFGNLFRAAGSGQAVSRPVVDNATESVMAAVTDGGIRKWLEIVWTYDDTTYQHCMLVTGLAAEFAKTLKFTQADHKHLVRGALLHDVGKSKIPLAILNKPGRLTTEELQVMRTHPEIGHELLNRQGHYEVELLEVVLRHHELLDGSGYPDGLSGRQISDLVRLITICDVYAALIERRPYKEPMQPARAFQMLEEMGEKLEAALVRAFAKVAENSAMAVAA